MKTRVCAVIFLLMVLLNGQLTAFSGIGSRPAVQTNLADYQLAFNLETSEKNETATAKQKRFKPKKQKQTARPSIDYEKHAWVIFTLVWLFIVLGLLGFAFGLLNGLSWLWILGLGLFGVVGLIDIFGFRIKKNFNHILTLIFSAIGFALLGILAIILGASLSISWVLVLGLSLAGLMLLVLIGCLLFLAIELKDSDFKIRF